MSWIGLKTCHGFWRFKVEGSRNGGARDARTIQPPG